jgi:MFS transporter, ACS family, solute carrier family 17 (sodium-dependent inorganic phosphate cotransporter), other
MRRPPGWASDAFICCAQGIAFAVPALCMITLAFLTPHGAQATASIFASSGGNVLAAAIIALMSVAFACGSWSRAGLYCNHQDLSPRFAGDYRIGFLVEVQNGDCTIDKCYHV